MHGILRFKTPHRNIWPVMLVAGLFCVNSLLFAADDLPAGKAEPDFVGIELGPGIINAVQKRKRKADWSQREIDAYYQVLDFARRTPYAQQRERAAENFQREIERFREEVEQEHRKRLKVIDDAGDRMNAFEAARQRSFAAQRHRQQLKLIEKFIDDPDKFPMFARMTNSLIREKEKSRFAGKLVTMRGHIRKLISYKAHPNTFGVTTLYEAWLYTMDSAKNPAVVICTAIPDGIPTGKRIVEDVTITGYAFRLHEYPTDMKNSKGEAGKLHVAPMLMAAKIEWHPRKPAAETPPWLAGAVIAGLLLIIAAIVLVGRRDKAEHRRQIERSLTGGESPVIGEPE